MPKAAPLPPLVGVDEVQHRLEAIFPKSFPDRSLLVGKMAARVVFVFLYGGFLEGLDRQLRPSVIYFFTAEQARRTTQAARSEWLSIAFRRGVRPRGKSWYADTSRESIRDDLIRNRLVSMGIVGRKAGVPKNASTPIYFLRRPFANLFNPTCEGPTLHAAIDAWRAQHLAPATLQRMALRAQGVLARDSDVIITMPDRTSIRISAGPSTPILKALIEDYAPRWLERPAVLWISASDRQTYPRFVELAASVSLHLDPQELLPDLILADLGQNLRFVFCEVVANDGPVDEYRKVALLELARRSGIDARNVRFVTAYLDRESAALRKTFHRTAHNSDLWFSTEPELLVRLTVAPDHE